ncbi:MAG: outer membrane beta-barrel protein [Limisphaerales bacterium]
MSNIALRNALIAAGVIGAGAATVAEEGSAVTALTPTVISGYVDTSIIWSMDDQDGAPQLPGRSFDKADKMDGFNLNVVKVGLEKPLDDSAWSAGYKVDLLFGPDAVGWNGSILGDNTSDVGIRQAYVALRADIGNGLDFKVGTFDTIIGYEVFEAGGNPNYSRSYGYFIEPTQHTGVLASYNLTDFLALNAGVANTHTPRINARGAEGQDANGNPVPADDWNEAFMASATVTLPEDSGFLAGMALYGGIVGGLGSDGTDADNKYNFYAGATVPLPITGVSVGVAYDYRAQELYNDPTDTSLGAVQTYANAFGGYVIWQVSEKLKLAGRGEYATGTSGTYTGVYTPGAGGEEYFGLTATLDYSLWANVISRVEFRWDKDLSNDRSFGSVDDPSNDAYQLALNLIYKF